MNKADFLNFLPHIPELEYALDSIGGSVELYQKLLLQIIRFIPSNIKEMDEYLCDGDLTAFGIKTHGVKGSLRQAGHLPLARIAETLEKAAKAGDLVYCRSHYEAFKAELLRFYKETSAAFESISGKTDILSKEAPNKDLNEYIDVLIQAQKALEDYDSLLAAELLFPLTKISGCFSELISKTIESLEMFRPIEAFEYIVKLLEKCGYTGK